ncbi:MAG: hypothetical protein WKH97_03020 [Casimicrobiaceae bacterium]
MPHGLRMIVAQHVDDLRVQRFDFAFRAAVALYRASTVSDGAQGRPLR